MERKTDKPKRGRPSSGQMPQRIFRMSDDDWTQVESAAISSGETTSEFIRQVLLKAARAKLKATAKEAGD